MRCLDANIWVYYFDQTLEEHAAVTPAVRHVLGSEPIFVPTVLQMEVVHYLEGQLSESRASTNRFLSLEDVVTAELTAADVERATEHLQTHPHVGIGGRDATVLAAMERFDVAELWTHDGGLQRIGDELDWLRVFDPVEEDV
ncbi:type II toxin-antitoxin system VapC family toxin [Salinadaptatus halalkaliphilus]|uniref:Ribonuclease VapC n=1 Tax=Salinadaptatus halalkaliphilus TaxID=2419781 RepID=A0A4S3TMD0_9EURY|nr:type II toxin-antitoxin system VapC family toxin [Salinadaptatus halalkaliphilus]THE65362.1 type II toxin-antitoxin system VapC family toxin [Salinadaptatus halalkaliphilus]